MKHAKFVMQKSTILQQDFVSFQYSLTKASNRFVFMVVWRKHAYSHKYENNIDD